MVDSTEATAVEVDEELCLICQERPAEYEGLVCFPCKEESDAMETVNNRAAAQPFYNDGQVTLYLSDARNVVHSLSDNSVRCVVTSPPYFNQRKYTDHPAEIGREATLMHYVEHLLEVFAPLRRVLTKDGNMFIVLGYKYERNSRNIILVPEALAAAMQGLGWRLWNFITWYKPVKAPESMKSRLTSTTERILCLSPRDEHYFNLDAVRLPVREASKKRLASARRQERASSKFAREDLHVGGLSNITFRRSRSSSIAWSKEVPSHPTLPGWDLDYEVPALPGKNPGDFWFTWRKDDYYLDLDASLLMVSVAGGKFSNPAPFPERLVSVILAMATEEGDMVLDPFVGSGTTCAVAKRMNRRSIGVDISRVDIEEAAERCRQLGLL